MSSARASAQDIKQLKRRNRNGTKHKQTRHNSVNTTATRGRRSNPRPSGTPQRNEETTQPGR
ncbi:uncharacterized protein LOC142771534 isoform X2 [Rhipicephalus microplus]|uniref:uncharacterized protein LOC142771534 isoform X2 n=1 Tax=Rhipicephalus microplus TaxID=6941 RepID=UPI003F6AA8F7